MKTIITLALFTLSLTTFAQADYTMQPIELRVNLIDDLTIIEWDAYYEVNTSYFIIEKQVNNQPFTTVATLPAGGSTYGVKQYQFEDAETDSTTLANYRITLVWMDGSRQSWIMNQDFTAAK